MAHFDLAIIGSGSGNSLITEDMADWRIAIVEDSIFGGTCLNVGCIPTKMFVYAADVAHTIQRSSRYGIDSTIDKVHWDAIRDRIFGRIDPISRAGREYRAHGPNTQLFEQSARFDGARSVRLDSGEQITADRIVIAAGSRPTVPDVVLDSGVPFHTSSTIMRLDELPRRLVILGGGFISAEFAHVFSQLGTEVSIVTRGAPLLRHLDLEVARRFTALAQLHWDLHLDAHPVAITNDAGVIRLRLDDDSVTEG
ncbi:MAG: FAD-dependent oxidoreductase, partial [Actinobacteria bacterium]|nr:FAD-dependent oxidoreductase [Actinomycetota bacterium]